MSKISGDQYFAKTLSAYGVTHFFHSPLITPGAMRLMEANEYKTQAISVHAEKAAAYMADGYARSTGKPGVCGCQSIGRSNLLAGLRDAYMAHSPVIAFTGGRLPEFRYRAPYQELEDQPAFSSLTKYNASIDDLARFPDMIRQAFREVTSGCPAPVHLEIAGMLGNISMGEMEDDDVVEPRFSAVPAFRPAAASEDVASVMEALAAAERPIIVAGGGVVASGAQQALCDFAAKHQIPVATSLTAKGAIPETDPLSVGVVGVYSKETANRAISGADLVFYVGSMTGGQVTNHWSMPAKGTKVIQLDIDPHWLGRNYPNIASLCGDARTVLKQLIDYCPPLPTRSEWLKSLAENKQNWNDKYAPICQENSQPFRPERAMSILGDYLPEDAILVSDTGHAGLWTAQFLDITSPKQTYIRASGSLGWAFPAALGAKCGNPDRPVFAFTGDGGFYYHFSELETAVRYGINTVTIVNNNFSLNQETPVWQKPPEGLNFDHHWKFGHVSLANIATEMGAFGIRVTDPKELKSALDKAVASNLPAVVELITDVEALAPRPWTPDQASYLLNSVGEAAADGE